MHDRCRKAACGASVRRGAVPPGREGGGGGHVQRALGAVALAGGEARQRVLGDVGVLVRGGPADQFRKAVGEIPAERLKAR